MDEEDYKRIEQGEDDSEYGIFTSIVLVIVVLLVCL